MLVHYPLNLLRIITFPKHSKGLVSRKSRAISPPKCICHIQKGYTSQMSNRSIKWSFYTLVNANVHHSIEWLTIL